MDNLSEQPHVFEFSGRKGLKLIWCGFFSANFQWMNLMFPLRVPHLLIICLLAIPLTGTAQIGSQKAFEQGYQAYMRNQFPIAEAHFRRAIQAATTNEDKAFILKFLGVSQYMRGDRRSAIGTFKNAVLLDPKISVFKEEVLDVSVITFFNRTKANVLKKLAQSTTKVSPPEKSSVTKTRKPRKKRRKKSKPAKKTDEELATTGTESSPEGGFRYSHLIPFGVGHFLDDSPIWGTTYALSQVTALFIHFDKIADIKKERDENASTLVRSDITQEAKDDFLAENNKFISVLETDAQVALSAFGVLYISSLVHGWLSSPEGTANNEKSSFLFAPHLKLVNHQREASKFTIFPYKSGLGIQFNLPLN